MSEAELLSRFENVRKAGRGRWTVDCPLSVHSPKLSIARATRRPGLMLHCHGGCSAGDVLDCVGLSFRDLREAQP
jgi:hypothetical protein